MDTNKSDDWEHAQELLLKLHAEYFDLKKSITSQLQKHNIVIDDTGDDQINFSKFESLLQQFVSSVSSSTSYNNIDSKIRALSVNTMDQMLDEIDAKSQAPVTPNDPTDVISKSDEITLKQRNAGWLGLSQELVDCLLKSIPVTLYIPAINLLNVFFCFLEDWTSCYWYLYLCFEF